MAALDRLRTAAGTMVRGPAQRPLTPPTDPRRSNKQGDINIGMNGRRHNAGCLTPLHSPSPQENAHYLLSTHVQVRLIPCTSSSSYTNLPVKRAARSR